MYQAVLILARNDLLTMLTLNSGVVSYNYRIPPAQTYESRCTQIRTRPICSAIPFMPHFAAVLLVFITLPKDPLPGALAPLPATTTHELLQGLWQMPLVATIFGEVPRLQHSICESQIIHSREMPNQDLKTHCGQRSIRRLDIDLASTVKSGV